MLVTVLYPGIKYFLAFQYGDRRVSCMGVVKAIVGNNLSGKAVFCCKCTYIRLLLGYMCSSIVCNEVVIKQV